MSEDNFSGLQESLGYGFCQPASLRLALTHSSYANEHGLQLGHNERLEYLGDAVLGLVIADFLYLSFPESREGELTRIRSWLVSENTLAKVARELLLQDYILLGRGERSQGGASRDSVLSDTLEAVFGAVFLDGGYKAAMDCIQRLFSKYLKQAKGSLRGKDPKTRLQELMHKHSYPEPVYNQTGHSGPAHNRRFEVSLVLPDDTVLTATGKSVKKAQQNVAGKALKVLENSFVPKES